MRTAFITHPDCLLHEMGPHHPESPARLVAIEKIIVETRLEKHLFRYEAPLVEREHLIRVHGESHVQLIEAMAPDRGYAELDPDTLMNPFSLSAAFRAAGAAVLATDLVMKEEVDNAFCAIRPPGHHATRRQSMGFCLFNNVAVGAAYAIEAYGLKRVAILDFDVHHGNGTEDIFHDDPRVLLCSTFQHPFYPHSGAETSNSHIINVPLKAGASGSDFRTAVTHYWLPSLEAFDPEFIFISAGFDAHAEDHLAALSLREEDYRWVTETLKTVAERCCKGRIVSLLEGGYALGALARSAEVHIRSLAGL